MYINNSEQLKVVLNECTDEKYDSMIQEVDEEIIGTLSIYDDGGVENAVFESDVFDKGQKKINLVFAPCTIERDDFGVVVKDITGKYFFEFNYIPDDLPDDYAPELSE